MKLEKIPGGYALYKEKTIIGTCQARPTEQGADITALTIVPEGLRFLPVKRGIAQPGRL
mgnify:CR=1 FL=1